MTGNIESTSALNKKKGSDWIHGVKSTKKERENTSSYFDKLLLGLLVAWVLVGMIFLGEEFVLFPDFLCGGTAADLEHFVVVCTGGDQSGEQAEE